MLSSVPGFEGRGLPDSSPTFSLVDGHKWAQAGRSESEGYLCKRLTRATAARNLTGKPREVCRGINGRQLGHMAAFHVLET